MIKLLVVDDSALMRRLLGTLFAQQSDFEIAFARDGIEALQRMDDFAPDVITLDVNMPHMDGLACLNQIMLRRPCPVVMLSSMTEAAAEVTLQAMALGAVDFVAKPFRAERIYRCLRNLLDVRFVLKPKPNDQPEPELSIDLGQLALGEDLAQRLSTAAELHSATVLKSCLLEVEQLGPSGVRLAQHLRQFLASYDMKTIQRVVAQIPVLAEPETQSSP